LDAIFGEQSERNAVWQTAEGRDCRLELPVAAGEDVYGFGLQLKSLRHTGKKRTLRVDSDPHADTGDSHAPIP
jgi:alpha-D-xyloside xylohydrolase